MPSKMTALSNLKPLAQELSSMDRDSIGYSLTSKDLATIRSVLKANKRKHRECTYWLDYYEGFTPMDRPGKDKEYSIDDVADGLRFGLFCKQLLAMNGIVVA